MTKGIVTYWGHDIKIAKDTLVKARLLITKLKLNPLLKDNLIGDIDRIIKVFNKGKSV